MGRKLEFDTSNGFWVNLQARYDLQCAEDAAGEAIARISPHRRSSRGSLVN